MTHDGKRSGGGEGRLDKSTAVHELGLDAGSVRGRSGDPEPDQQNLTAISPDRHLKFLLIMPRQSAALLVFRRRAGKIEVLLVHPGGPFWAKKDEGAWSLPKGEIAAGEDAIAAARREFVEETGFAVPGGALIPLGSARLKSGKVVHAWAVEGEVDPGRLCSNWTEIDWPPRSGRRLRIPEVDRAGYFPLDEARGRINRGQGVFLERLEALPAPDSRPSA
jgi:predicted NUDIX family NTP pyrophosphohydrolase